MKKLILLLSAGIFVLSACGPSEKEIEARQEQLKDSLEKISKDSLTKAVENTTLKKEAFKDSLEKSPINQKRLKIRLVALQEKYEAACTKLKSLEHHKFLRSKRKKEEQIEKQTEVAEQLKNRIDFIKSRLK